ncbi:MAG: HEAT repeat domain-containing protein [Candidatus Omnitrophica bacterium]|nr:HEAT repeat domain-containing protein [Candidatus Omnitrophota bacterium]
MSILHKKRMFLLIFTAVFLLSSGVLFAQTGAATRSSRSSSTSFRQERNEEQRQGAVRDFVMAVIGGMLRHPDPTIRKQAIQTVSVGLAGGEGADSSEGGVMNLFSFSDEGSGSEGSTSTGVGGTVFIPDLYVLLADPDPEVRDVASVGLDMIFQTDSTLLKFMSDPEPLIRKYATQIYSKKRIASSQEDSSDEEDLAAVRDLLGLRTLLVRLKYEKEPTVRKAIIESLEYYIKYGGDEEGTDDEKYGIFGVDSAITTDYLNDPDPELRKQAIKTIALRERTDDVLIKLMERLRVEKDEGVRAELVSAMDAIRSRSLTDEEQR